LDSSINSTGCKNKYFVITIDGPAASGKSTTSLLVAKKLGWIYLDTGAMYRALTVKVLQYHIPLDQKREIGRLTENTIIELDHSQGITRVLLDGRDVASEIRRPEVDLAVGPVSEIPKVRSIMVSLQRKVSERGNVVAEGRDMGTVVFPDADLKFFMDASINERVKRRKNDMSQQGINISVDELKKDIERRDKRDREREHSPLMPANGAIQIDTTNMSVQQQVDFIIYKVIQVQEDEKLA
jgi:cytidylate kinase